MLLNGYDLGKCGIEQVLCAGKVSFDTKDVSKGIVLIELPQNIIITKAVAVVNTAFNAATTNVLTIRFIFQSIRTARSTVNRTAFHTRNLGQTLRMMKQQRFASLKVKAGT